VITEREEALRALSDAADIIVSNSMGGNRHELREHEEYSIISAYLRQPSFKDAMTMIEAEFPACDRIIKAYEIEITSPERNPEEKHRAEMILHDEYVRRSAFMAILGAMVGFLREREEKQ